MIAVTDNSCVIVGPALYNQTEFLCDSSQKILMSSESFKDAEIAFLEQQNSRALASLKQLECDRSTINRQILDESAALEEVRLFVTIRMHQSVDEKSSFIERE